MSKITRAFEILEAINKFYKEGDNESLPCHAVILDDNTCIADAIWDCLGGREDQHDETVPSSKRRRWAYHPTTGYSGWVGKRKMIRFYTKEEAIEWVNEQR